MYVTATFVQGGSVFAPTADYLALGDGVTYSHAIQLNRASLVSRSYLTTDPLGRRIARLFDKLLPWPEPMTAGLQVARYIVIMKLFMQLKTNYDDSWAMYLRSATDAAGRVCDYLTLSTTANLWLSDEERANIRRAVELSSPAKSLDHPAHDAYFGHSDTNSFLARWIAICADGSKRDAQTAETLAAIRYQILADSLGGVDMEGGFKQFVVSRPDAVTRESLWAAARRFVEGYPPVAVDPVCSYIPDALDDLWARAMTAVQDSPALEVPETQDVVRSPLLDGSPASMIPAELRRIAASSNRVSAVPRSVMQRLSAVMAGRHS